MQNEMSVKWRDYTHFEVWQGYTVILSKVYSKLYLNHVNLNRLYTSYLLIVQPEL